MRFGIWELLIILLIVVFLFGTKRIKSLGADLGSAIKSFRGAVREEQNEAVEKKDDAAKPSGRVIEAEARAEQTTKEHG
jgi:sec-independent protein translocase protein TatA